jgi:guanylate kinase
MIDKGSLIVLSGPSGTGKGTLLAEFKKVYGSESIVYSVSDTTRAIRPGEIPDVSYHYITNEEFNHKKENGGYLEYASFCENQYGTPKKFVMDNLEKGIDVVLEIETVGARKVKESYPDAVMVFILPPSLDELKRRLIGRGTESMEVIEKRFNAAKDELKLAVLYDYVIVNDSIEKATYEFYSVITAERLKTKNNKKIISEVCK